MTFKIARELLVFIKSKQSQLFKDLEEMQNNLVKKMNTFDSQIAYRI